MNITSWLPVAPLKQQGRDDATRLVAQHDQYVSSVFPRLCRAVSWQSADPEEQHIGLFSHSRLLCHCRLSSGSQVTTETEEVRSGLFSYPEQTTTPLSSALLSSAVLLETCTKEIYTATEESLYVVPGRGVSIVVLSSVHLPTGEAKHRGAIFVLAFSASIETRRRSARRRVLLR